MNLFFLSFLTGGLGAWMVAKIGLQFGICDIPNHRSSHSKLVPKGAGICIVLAFVVASLSLHLPLWLWFPSMCISLVSLWGGDRHLLSAKSRLIAQLGCSLFFLFFVLKQTQPSFCSFLLPIPLSVFIVGTSNFYNFMDGIDGIAGITSVVGFWLLWFYINLSEENQVYGTLCLVLVFSSLGFLCFNLPRARVFLGDVGSVFLGFLFSCLVIRLSESLLDFIVMTGFLAPFYFDELFTMVGRVKQKDSLIIPHRKHTYQLLANELGISHWKISLCYGFFQLLIGLSGIYLVPKGSWGVLSGYLGYGLTFLVFSKIIRKKVFEQ